MVPAMRINGKPSNVGWGAISPTKWWRSTAATLGTTMRRVTLPMVTRTILFNLILSVIGAMQTFVRSCVMTDGGPDYASLLYVLYSTARRSHRAT